MLNKDSKQYAKNMISYRKANAKIYSYTVGIQKNIANLWIQQLEIKNLWPA